MITIAATNLFQNNVSCESETIQVTHIAMDTSKPALDK